MFCGHCGYNNPNTTLRTPAQQQRPVQAPGAQTGMGAQRPAAAPMPQTARPGVAPMAQPQMPQAGRPAAGMAPQQPVQRPARTSHNLLLLRSLLPAPTVTW